MEINPWNFFILKVYKLERCRALKSINFWVIAGVLKEMKIPKTWWHGF
jgi:hypothetical protein